MNSVGLEVLFGCPDLLFACCFVCCFIGASPPPPIIRFLLRTLSFTLDCVPDCHEIRHTTVDSSALEDYLSNIPDYSNNNRRICKKLNLSDCNQLAAANHLTPFYLAERYLDQTAEPCWEYIVRMICKEFKERNLAKRVADEHMKGADYQQYCK